MFSIFDRYVVREVLLPLLLSLLLITFLLVIPPILREGYALIAKGVEWTIVARVLVTLLPQALSISIPIAVLLALLIAFGRLSADREFVAMQACGVSIYRLLRPVTVIALATTAATLYVTVVALPNANQTFREITLGYVKSQVETAVKPRVFFNTFPERVLLVRDLPATGGWRDVFFADTHTPGETIVYFAREGRIVVDRDKKFVQLQLLHGTQHLTRGSSPDMYDVSNFESISLSLDAQQVFPAPPSRGAAEMTIAELRQRIAAFKPTDRIAVDAHLMIQTKYTFPAACCVLSLIALALGVSNRKDGKLASFAIGFIVVFVYYVLFYMGRAAAIGGVLDPDVALWISPVVLGVAGVVLTVWRARSTDRPIFIAWPVRRAAAAADRIDDGGNGAQPVAAPFLTRAPRFSLPWIKILDQYAAQQYVRVFGLAVLSALGIFYISTFIDLADKLFRGSATMPLLLRFFYYQTPQYVYYIIPIAGLLATLVTVGIMTKNSELVVMKACGISLYRAAAPLLLLAAAASLALFGLQEVVLARANEEAERLNGVIRGFPVESQGQINRWMLSESGDIYHYDFFDGRTGGFQRFTKYHLDPRTWRLGEVTFAERVTPSESSGDLAASSPPWRWQKGWVRTFTQEAAKTAVAFVQFSDRLVPLEPRDYFETDTPDSGKMTYRQLSAYISQLKARGFNAVPPMVQLQRKVAFPFVTIIMTLLAVPFAVTTGRRGAMYGIGIGIALSIAYWVILNVFSAIGEGGVLTPILAAWAPNLIFGAAALYGVLTVRT